MKLNRFVTLYSLHSWYYSHSYLLFLYTCIFYWASILYWYKESFYTLNKIELVCTQRSHLNLLTYCCLLFIVCQLSRCFLFHLTLTLCVLKFLTQALVTRHTLKRQFLRAWLGSGLQYDFRSGIGLGLPVCIAFGRGLVQYLVSVQNWCITTVARACVWDTYIHSTSWKKELTLHIWWYGRQNLIHAHVKKGCYDWRHKQNSMSKTAWTSVHYVHTHWYRNGKHITLVSFSLLHTHGVFTVLVNFSGLNWH